MEDKTKKTIDCMTYEELLSRWRFAPLGDPMFIGETGAYYQKVLSQKQNALKPGEAAAISKSIGWTKP